MPIQITFQFDDGYQDDVIHLARLHKVLLCRCDRGHLQSAEMGHLADTLSVVLSRLRDALEKVVADDDTSFVDVDFEHYTSIEEYEYLKALTDIPCPDVPYDGHSLFDLIAVKGEELKRSYK